MLGISLSITVSAFGILRPVQRKAVADEPVSEGDDLRDLPLTERKRRLAKLLGRAKHAIRYRKTRLAKAARRDL